MHVTFCTGQHHVFVCDRPPLQAQAEWDWNEAGGLTRNPDPPCHDGQPVWWPLCFCFSALVCRNSPRYFTATWRTPDVYGSYEQRNIWTQSVDKRHLIVGRYFIFWCSHFIWFFHLICQTQNKWINIWLWINWSILYVVLLHTTSFKRPSCTATTLNTLTAA